MASFSRKWLQVSEPHPHVFHVKLSRGPVNAFSPEYWREYGKLFETLAEAHASGTDIRVVVLSSAFPKVFTAGLDMSNASALGALISDTSQDLARAFFARRKFILEAQHAISAPERCPFPVVVALHGPVVGLGVDLISACDVRYAASDASFSIKEVDIGLALEVGTLAHLPNITGNLSLMRELTYTGRVFYAVEAERLGLVSKVIEGGHDAVVAAAVELGRVIAAKSPVAVAGAKHLITHARDHSVEENLAYTATWNAAALMTKDISENLRAMNAKELPEFCALGVPSKL